MSPIERIEALLAEATSGPWFACDGESVITGYGDRVLSDDGVIVRNPADSGLVAALRNAAPALLRLVKAADAMTGFDVEHDIECCIPSSWDPVDPPPHCDCGVWDAVKALDEALAELTKETDQ